MRRLLLTVVLLGVVGGIRADDRRWENPVYESWQEAVAAATKAASGLNGDSPRAQQFFVDLTLVSGDRGRHESKRAMAREIVGNLLITHPMDFIDNSVQMTTVNRFIQAAPRQQEVLRARLIRFGYPDLPGMVYLRLVESVDAFSGLNSTSSDKMSQVGGVTYYCRYVVLPLSYVGETAIREIRRSAAMNPGINAETTHNISNHRTGAPLFPLSLLSKG